MTDAVNGRYELLDSLGQGGYGEVYRAHDRTLDRFVALKQLHAMNFGPKVKERFLEEARISSQLAHPAALMIFDFGVNEFGDPYLVSELLQGLSLHDYLKSKMCSATQTLNILIEVAGVLSEAHNIGIVHRDLKPANLYLHIPPAKKQHAEAQIKLLDFGIAKIMQQEGGGATKTGAIVGTPAYIAPEQIKDSSKVNHLCDQYSLGLVAWSALHGKRPFVGENEFELMHKQIHEDLPPLESNSEGADELYKIIQRMCAKEPEDRYKDTLQLLGALEELKAKSKVFSSTSKISLAGMVSVESNPPRSYTGSKIQSLKFSSLQKSLKAVPTPMTVQKVGLESFMETIDQDAARNVSSDLSQGLSYEECLDNTITPDADESEATVDFVSDQQTKGFGREVNQEASEAQIVDEQDIISSSLLDSQNSSQHINRSSNEAKTLNIEEADSLTSGQVSSEQARNYNKIYLLLGLSLLVLILFILSPMWSSDKKAKVPSQSKNILKPLSSTKKPRLGSGRKFSRHRVVLIPRQSSLGYAIGSEIEVMVKNRLGAPQDYFEVTTVPQCLQKIDDPVRQIYRVVSENCGEITVKVNRDEVSTTIKAQTLLDDALGELE